MTVFNPDIDAMLTSLEAHAGLSAIIDGYNNPEFDHDLVAPILEEAGKLARDVIAPTNREGDQKGAILNEADNTVTLPKSFHNAYNQYRDAGWNAMPFPTEYGGQDLPVAMAFAVQELWQAANLSFGLCPLLNQSAVEAILAHGSDQQKEQYLPKLVSGEWTGTMNLTEPQAGSDLSAVRAKAEPVGDDSYKISGQKIYITYGEHDLADNIIHLVLARLPDAPEGVKGISLFIVPKVLDDDARNTVSCVGIEHKLGINASPTAVMQYDEAVGYLVGEAHQGLKYMFTMMNNARLSVGLQGVAVAERARQQAHTYAKDRVQGYALEAKTKERTTIDAHGDVKRMLLESDALVTAGRALTYFAAGQLDRLRQGDDTAQARVDILTPLVKGWCTDLSERVTSLNIQVHGGMGFVEETGAAQLYRDARILPIYEGTNGIQANDLTFRKTVRDNGVMVTALLDEMGELSLKNGDLKSSGDILTHAIEQCREAVTHIITIAKDDMNRAAAVSYPYLNLMAVTTALYVLLKGADSNTPSSGHIREINYFAQMYVADSSGQCQAIKTIDQIILS